MRIDFGGGTFCSFDSTLIADTPLRTKLEFVLEDVRELVHAPERKGWVWILKPSVTNKGVGISLVRDWDDLMDALENFTDMRYGIVYF